MGKCIAVLAGLLVWSAATQAQQVCSDRINATASTGRFSINADGTATDRRTGLTWQRCMMGFEFRDNGTPAFVGDDTCVPSVTTTFTWQQALQTAATLNAQGGFAGFTDWRVPNVKELGSIVEMKCASPAIDLAIFPDTPTTPEFFTSSPSIVGTPTVSVWVVNFDDGSDTTAVVNSGTSPPPAKFVRLVR